MNFKHPHVQISGYLVCTMVVTAMPASAQSEISLYGGWINSDLSSLEDAVKNATPQGAKLGIEVDYSFGLRYTYWAQNQWGIGLDYNSYGLSSKEIIDGFQSSSYSLIGLRRIDLGTSFEPYIGAGFGVQMKELDFLNEGQVQSIQYDPAFLATGVAGASYELSDQFSVFTEFKFDYTSEAASDDTSEIFSEQVQPSVNFGVSLSF